MKLATLRVGGRDGILAVVDRHLTRIAPAARIAPTLQAAIEDWERLAPRLEALYHALNRGELEGQAFDPATLASPLPRAYQWLDGSAYLSHVERVRRARGAMMPAEFATDPLMYQGNSARFLGPCEPIAIADGSWEPDLEAEIAVVTDDVAAGVSPSAAGARIKLLMLCNDISLRGLIPAELAKGFGFLHGKPGPAFSPVAATPDELGDVWDGAKLHLPVISLINGVLLGKPNAGEDMQFDFPSLIAHAAKTRCLPAGTVLGSGTISNRDVTRGCACLVERRSLEVVERGNPATPYLRDGDRVRIEMFDSEGQSIFGAIDQEVRVWPR
jgi:fumarylacetoacetate (FAA) hydrolase